jgi:hypothetical protein
MGAPHVTHTGRAGEGHAARRSGRAERRRPEGPDRPGLYIRFCYVAIFLDLFPTRALAFCLVIFTRLTIFSCLSHIIINAISRDAVRYTTGLGQARWVGFWWNTCWPQGWASPVGPSGGLVALLIPHRLSCSEF